MSDTISSRVPLQHSHSFLGAGHKRSERKAWAVIWLCGAMMIAEVIGGMLFGSIALVADGMHMSTHAGALLLAALAYTYARKYADDPRFTFGTGKFGDLAGFTSAIILAMIALLIGYESISRILNPVPIAFVAHVRLGEDNYPVVFYEHEHAHGSADRDNNMRAAVIHVIADAAVSVLVIVGLLLARAFEWLWMDPLAGIIGAYVIASWSYGLMRDTGSILLDMNPDRRMTDNLRQTIESDGDQIGDLHLWRLGPGHLGAIVSVSTKATHGPDYYRTKLARFRTLSHLTIEVRQT